MNDQPLIDAARLLDRFEGDKELFAEVIEVFTSETPQRVAKFHEALETGDMQRLVHLAHALKGASATLQAEPLREACYRLELAARGAEAAVARSLAADVLTLLESTSAQMLRIDINSL